MRSSVSTFVAASLVPEIVPFPPAHSHRGQGGQRGHGRPGPVDRQVDAVAMDVPTPKIKIFFHCHGYAYRAAREPAQVP